LRWLAVDNDYVAYLRESKKESILVFISRKGVKATLDLKAYGYVVKQTLYGQSAEGAKIVIDSKSATQAVWVVESSQKRMG
jgi:hypothetical protein